MDVVNSSNLVQSRAASSGGGKRTKDPQEGVGISPYNRDKIDFAKNRGAKPEGGGKSPAAGAKAQDAPAPGADTAQAPQAAQAAQAPRAGNAAAAQNAAAPSAAQGGVAQAVDASLRDFPPELKGVFTLIAQAYAQKLRDDPGTAATRERAARDAAGAVANNPVIEDPQDRARLGRAVLALVRGLNAPYDAA